MKITDITVTEALPTSLGMCKSNLIARKPVGSLDYLRRDMHLGRRSKVTQPRRPGLLSLKEASQYLAEMDAAEQQRAYEAMEEAMEAALEFFDGLE